MFRNAAIIALLGLMAVPAFALTLIQDGTPVSVIVLGDNPVPSQRVAAEDLQYHLKRMTGAVIPIVAEKDLGDTNVPLILVGQSELLRSKGIDTSQLQRETFIVKTLENALVLAGEDGAMVDPFGIDYSNSRVRTGTLFAVSDFLHDQLGVRWLWPGPSGEAIPKRKTVEVGALDVQETPKLFQRHYRHSFRARSASRRGRGLPLGIENESDLYNQMMQEENLWLKRMKMGYSTRFGYGHAFTQWYEKYIDTVPEVFAMQKDGHRGIPNPDYRKDFVKMCPSSDKLVEMLIEQFLEARKDNPDHRFLNACENDGNGGFCQCPACLALDVKLNDATQAQLQDLGWSGADIDQVFGEKDDGLPYSLSNRYFHFYNKLARRLAEVAPDAMVVAYAYDRYKFAPIDLKTEPNILVGLIAFNMYPATDEETKLQRDNFWAWKKAGAKNMFFRPNSFAFSPAIGIPWNDVSQMAGDLKLLLDNGIVATDWDSLNGYWATAAQTYYVLTRLHWDTTADPEALRQEFNLAFGPAAEHVGAYFDHWEKVMIAAYTQPDIKEILRPFDPKSGRRGRWQAVHVLLKQEDFDKARECLTKARAAAEASGDPDLLTQIEVLELGLRHGELIVRGSAFANDAEWNAEKTDAAKRKQEIEEIYNIRRRLLELRAHNVWRLFGAEGNMYATRLENENQP
jgi:hypothetical protein